MSAVIPEKNGEGESEKEMVAGELLYCGSTSWDAMGRKGPSNNLLSPTRLRPLVGINIRSVASGCSNRSYPILY